MDDAQKSRKRNHFANIFKRKKRQNVSDLSIIATPPVKNDPTTSREAAIQSSRMQATETGELMVIVNSEVGESTSPLTEADTMQRSTQNPLLSSALESHSGSAVRLDSRNARKRYLDAVKLLDRAVKSHGTKWGSFDFPELKGEPLGFNDSQFREKIAIAMEARENQIENRNWWSRCMHVVECAFTALSPFAKHFLTIAKEGQAITVLNPYGLLCGGLLLLTTIADKEIARRENLDRTLEDLTYQFAHLEVIKALPNELRHREFVVNRAFDVRSSSMAYLALTISHDATPLGVSGRVLRTFFLGDTEITDAETYFKTCVQNFRRALNDMVSIPLTIEVWELVKGMATLNIETSQDSFKQIENKFMIPYEANPHFLGRIQFLESLRQKLSDVAPRRYNHRIALYGMGGIGKTQCAIGYVYRYRDLYERTYWITAVDRSSLLSGYVSIAKAAQLPYPSEAKPSDVADIVLAWLREESNWLIVIDNLDEIEVANGLLPENGPKKHTLITTRNPNTIGIPAEPLEVPLLERDDAIDLLASLSGISLLPDYSEHEQALAIVQTLDSLPLAIDQAAAYVREVGISFAEYLTQYERNCKLLHTWVPGGNRQYPESIATTWSMSFSLLPEVPTRLLRLFSFLRPDGILISFLQAGAEAFDGDLRTAIMEEAELAKCLLEMEKASLIKWDRSKKLIIIHRLVQAVVRDSLRNEQAADILTAIARFVVRALPYANTTEAFSRFRRFQPQVSEFLHHLNLSRSRESADVMRNIGFFLSLDGKFAESEASLKSSMDLYCSLLGPEHAQTLQVMGYLGDMYCCRGRLDEAVKTLETATSKATKNLGEENLVTLELWLLLLAAYRSQGRLDEGAQIQEDLLEKMTRLLGENDETTILTMLDLGRTYNRQGKFAEAAEVLYRVAQKYASSLGDTHPHALKVKHQLAIAYRGQRKTSDAVAVLDETLQNARNILGEDHPETLAIMFSRAIILEETGI